MTTLNPNQLRDIRSFEDVIEYLTDELDWPIGAGDLEEATFDWDPDELGIPAERVPHLASLRQLRPLETDQPWGIFFLEFDGPRLPLTALRRLLDKLVTKKRTSGSGTLRTWKLDDLLFIITTSTGDTVELHFVAFFEQPDGPAEIRSLPWRPAQSPAQHLTRLATELLPHLAWPDDPGDVEEWSKWREAFKLRHGEAIRSTGGLVERMASTAQRLRDNIRDELDAEDGDGPFSELLGVVRSQLLATATAAQFADMCAQTLVYGALTSRITAPEAFGASPTLAALPLSNPFLSAFFEEVHDHASQLDLESTGLEQLAADLKASNIEAILDQFGSTAKGGDPVIHFYEDFLARYDPEMRIQAGAFYTPQAAVHFMVRNVNAALTSRIGIAGGAASTVSWADVAASHGLALPGAIDPASPFVSMLDPAVGTGTFLVEWIRQARDEFERTGREEEWPGHLVSHVLPQMHGLELMLAPYAVAHLKVALELHESGVDDEQLGILLTDTLQRGHAAQLAFEPDAVSVEGERADDVKRNERVTIIIGNPPYDRVARDAGGGWITDNSAGRCLFDDLLDPAIEHTVFSHHASLYNKFVYFWRWSLWKVFEDRQGLPGIVSLIAPSSWLTGPGFLGLRQLVRQHGDDIWVVDLGGDNRGTRRDENIFDIETPVAIVTVCRRDSGSTSTPARARYRRISGTRAEKLDALIGSVVDLEGDEWSDVSDGWFDVLVPPTGDAGWSDHPPLADLFPWQQPGCMFNRTWPIAPEPDALRRRWQRFVSTDDHEDRSLCFFTSSSGRNIDTRVSGRVRLADEPVGAPPPPIARYGYRSFDRQWAFEDPRLAKTESPSLWASQSRVQIFMSSLLTGPLGLGPAVTASTAVPDKHLFRGSFGGKDVIPLFRDAAGTPNVYEGTIDAILSAQGAEGAALSPTDLFTYCYGLLAGADYTERFAAELETPGPRVPLTADARLFADVAAHGRELLWLHTFGDRFAVGRAPASLLVPGIAVLERIVELPESNRAISYDQVVRVLRVGSGSIGGVAPAVWDFAVSGMQVVKKWLGYRTARGAGRSASSTSPLDHIRPESWSSSWTTELLELLSVLHQTIDLIPEGVGLLEAVLAGPLITAQQLPPIPASLREPPAVTRHLEGSALPLKAPD